MNNKIIALLVAAVVILGGIFLVMNNKMASEKAMMEKDTMMKQKEMTPQDGATQKDSAMMEKDAMMAKDAGVTDTMAEDKMMMKGGYMDYDASKLAFAEKGKVVLFFKADWCPTCKALDADITKNLSQIPADVLILKVNYDTATDLKKKYSVLGQHTLVSVDKDGNAKATWRGSATLTELLSELK